MRPSNHAGGRFGGYFTESDSTGDIHKFTTGLAAAFERHGGAACLARWSWAWPAIAGRNVDFECDGVTGAPAFRRLVVSAGIGSRALATQLGDRINIYPVKGYSITVNLLIN